MHVELNLSADELGKIIGKNRATIYRYENNEIVNIPHGVIKSFSKALKVTPSWIMGWE